MRYFLDTEFNGFGGQLISLALVPMDADTPPFYEVLTCAEPTPWTRDHVIPVLGKSIVSRAEVTERLAAYLRDDQEPVVTADWPADIAHLTLLMLTGSGSRVPSPRLIIELLDLPLFDSAALSAKPHNALQDAIAFRNYIRSQEL